MNVLIAFESSGTLRRRFQMLGHTTYSVDLLPADDGEQVYHLQCDALHAIYNPQDVGLDQWDLLVAHPPCTYLTSSGLHWNKRVPGRVAKTEAALDMVRAVLAAPIAHIAVENPVGCIGTRIRKADQYVQPYEFGDDASKRTGLWLKGLPALTKNPTLRCPGRMVDGKERWANQTDSGQNALPPSDDRWKTRSKTYPGLANAVAWQWHVAITEAAEEAA